VHRDDFRRRARWVRGPAGLRPVDQDPILYRLQAGGRVRPVAHRYRPDAARFCPGWMTKSDPCDPMHPVAAHRRGVVRGNPDQANDVRVVVERGCRQVAAGSFDHQRAPYAAHSTARFLEAARVYRGSWVDALPADDW